jgi:Tol biopolymer transport system component
MTVTTPQRPPQAPAPDVPDDLEALIEEARRRARRRRLRNAAALSLAAGAVVVGAVGAWRLGDGGSAPASVEAARLPTPVPIHRGPLPRNGDIALVHENTLVAEAPDGSRTRVLSTCPPTHGECYFESFSWAPNGLYLAFFAGHLGGAYTPNNVRLYIVSTEPGKAQELARCGDCQDGQIPAWSPDSRKVAFVDDTGGRVVVDVSGEWRKRPDTAGAAAFRSESTGPAWSPGGSRLAFADGASLYVERPNGAGLSRIALVQPLIADLSWSPDGTKIAFDTGDSIYVIDADGTHLRRLLAGGPGSGPGVPSWSPDGTRILYFNTPGSPNHFTGEVWSMRPDGSDRRRLYDAGCCVGDWHPPIWSPDGRWIAFSGATETDGVVVMDAQGKQRRQLYGFSSVIAWQPVPRLGR